MVYDPDKWIAQLIDCQHLPEQDMKILCNTVQAILLEEANIQPILTPVTICGDIHSQFWDLFELLRKGSSMPETSFGSSYLSLLIAPKARLADPTTYLAHIIHGHSGILTGPPFCGVTMKFNKSPKFTDFMVGPAFALHHNEQ
ncbi:hypothetical protein F5141DRAFT_1066803 [Pisolithus sp. B1]|nr:hypothetical protein F5141DRAFT_1066803 [Pisolithus sp. B1]